MHEARKARLAIIGSGLAGEAIASRLASSFHVTVFERGGRLSNQRPSALWHGDNLGMRATANYAVGGTTALWRGALLDMEPMETSFWLGILAHDFERHQDEFIAHLASLEDVRIFRARRRETFGDCTLSAFLLPKPIPRMRFAQTWKKVDLRSNCLVQAVDEGDKGPVVIYRKSGSVKKERFEKVIIACGALNSPCLLRRSGLGGDQVGYNLTDHPTGLVAKLIFDEPDTAQEIMRQPHPRLRSIIKIRDSQTNLWTGFQLTPAIDSAMDFDHYIASVGSRWTSFEMLSRRLSKLRNGNTIKFKLRHAIGATKIERYAYVLAMTEQEPFSRRYVVESKAGEITSNWRISERSVDALNRNIVALADSLGARLVFPSAGTRGRLWSGAHHAGTCRISSSEYDGVVDENTRVFGTKNIYVCDASILPSTGASHTSLQIGALSFRLARRLRAEADIRCTALY